MKRPIVFFLFLCLTTGIITAENVKLLTRPCEKDSILLRWGPTDKQAWDLGNQYGYVVERYTILRNGKQPEEPERKQLTAYPLKPAPIGEWEKYEEDRYVNIAAECIFGEVSIPAVSPTAIAKQYQLEQNRFSFALYAADQSIRTARLSGLYLADKTARPDEKYLYSVHIALPDSLPNDTAFTFTGLSEYQPLPKPLEFSGSWNDKKVDLSWNVLYLSHIYNSYIVEKSTDNKTYTPISDNAKVQVSDSGISPEYGYWTDSLPDNRTEWYYRIRGVSAFGETGPPSDSIVGHGRIPITIAPTVVNKEVINNKEVLLTWDYPEEMNEYISGFRIYRSAGPKGKKKRISEITQGDARTFSDKNPGLTNYYILSVFDSRTEKFTPAHTYAELVDSIPPAPPVNFAGSIDSTGVVSLAWAKNTEADIDGYRVYRSNNPDFEFMLISPELVTDTVFTDSVQLKTLTKNVYYRLRAVDLRQNQSDFGEILELKRPDIIPPVAPLIQSVTQQKNGIQITWYNSSSIDVAAHHIHRKEANDTVFQIVATIEKQANKPLEKQSSYTDNTIQPGETYIYYVTAEDDSGLISESSSPVQQKAPGQLAQQIVLKKEESLGATTLKWTIQSKKKVVRVLIYKAENDEPLKLYDNTTADSYTDNTTGFEKTFRYKIRAVYEDETSSELSNEVKVKL
ncbi:hypothetical protein D0T49_01220 [Paludibacter sp. 221]|uniref:fibronectin type III domain-containing protein n=1 Tax=Paludibacter sp. 221 TaxID=2302939 RepID=UPI0013D718DF|nr:hypothetical protein [Paludibacter sp. 221]NDV45671.1 hypothetical protein [Paludibacter sp. 221]